MKNLHTPEYTIRELPGDTAVLDDAWDMVVRATAFASSILGIEQHVFVTAIGSFCVQALNDIGFGYYQWGGYNIAVAAGDELAEEMSRAEWLNEIANTTIHELVHCWQDANGKGSMSEEGVLENVDQLEEEAEEKTKMLFDAFILGDTLDESHLEMD